MSQPFQELYDRVNIYNEFLKDSEMRMQLIEENHVIAKLNADQRLLNFYGYIHGGAIYSLADTACGICAMTNAPDAVTLWFIKLRASRPCWHDVCRSENTSLRPHNWCL